MTEFHPLADDTASATIAGLTFENGTDKVSVYGEAEFARDARGLEAARRLRDLFGALAAALESGVGAPPPPAEKPVPVDNPFA